ncbi:MAG: helix-turn-helix transcriptional regulator [Granulosicoccus sp.]
MQEQTLPPVIDSPKALGTALRKTRKQLGLTQPELALASGVGVRFIVELEAGKPTIQLGRALQVIDALGAQLVLNGCDP